MLFLLSVNQFKAFQPLGNKITSSHFARNCSFAELLARFCNFSNAESGNDKRSTNSVENYPPREGQNWQVRSSRMEAERCTFQRELSVTDGGAKSLCALRICATSSSLM